MFTGLVEDIGTITAAQRRGTGMQLTVRTSIPLAEVAIGDSIAVDGACLTAERFDGEEDIPDWFFEQDYVFLPEEIEVGLRLPNRQLRRLFRDAHGDLYTVAYWQALQQRLRDGKPCSLAGRTGSPTDSKSLSV